MIETIARLLKQYNPQIRRAYHTTPYISLGAAPVCTIIVVHPTEIIINYPTVVDKGVQFGTITLNLADPELLTKLQTTIDHVFNRPDLRHIPGTCKTSQPML